VRDEDGFELLPVSPRKVVDVWLLIRCEQCGRTAKIPVHERVCVQALEPGRLLKLEGNDRSMVRGLAVDRTQFCPWPSARRPAAISPSS